MIFDPFYAYRQFHQRKYNFSMFVFLENRFCLSKIGERYFSILAWHVDPLIILLQVDCKKLGFVAETFTLEGAWLVCRLRPQPKQAN